MSTKRKAPAKLAAPIVKANARRATKTTIDESRTSVSTSHPVETVEDEASIEDSEADVSADEEVQLNGKKGSIRAADEKDGEDEDGEEDAEPTFGELLRVNGEAIDVAAVLREQKQQQQTTTTMSDKTPAPRSVIVAPSHQSLVTVLSQALSTDDADLLESCLHTTDLVTIRNTIERIDSSLAGVLLGKLAARLHRRPGRAGTLMTWVQWTLVAHGGALASHPKIVHSLGSLHKVLADRARGLNSLLALKGKLDILEGQMELRRKMQSSSTSSSSALRDARPETNGTADEEDVIYVEGEGDEEEEEEAAVANGFVGFSDDDEEEGESDVGEGSDEEEEEALDEDDVNYDDVDEDEDESDVEAVAPPAKVQKVKESFGRKK